MKLYRLVPYMLLTAIFAFSICGNAAGQHKNFILVIDPGHGGEDPGATSGRFLEKGLNLDVALALGALIRREMPDVDVLYTRTDDRAVGLAARGDFANRAGADLFLSIHANANASSSPNGSETYVMGMATNEENLEVAKRENEVIRYEEDYTETYAGFDPSSTEMSIIFGMLQYANFESSLGFARLIQKHYAAGTSLKDRGSKQNIYVVLWKPTMPRVLTEIGFISNDSDRRYMFSDKGKAAIAKALFEAFREYKGSLPADTGTPRQTTSNPTQTAATPPPATTPAASTAAQPKPAATTQPKPAPTPVTSPAASDKPAAVTPPAGEFYIQLAATRTRTPATDAVWGPWRGKVIERSVDGWYKYSLGPYPTRAKAEAALGDVRRGRFAGAFIVEIESNQKK